MLPIPRDWAEHEAKQLVNMWLSTGSPEILMPRPEYDRLVELIANKFRHIALEVSD